MVSGDALGIRYSHGREQTQRHRNPLFWWQELYTLCYKPHPIELEESQSPQEPGLKFTLAVVLIALDYKKCNRFGCHEGDKVLWKFENFPSVMHITCDFPYSVWQASVLCRNPSRCASIHSACYVSSSGLMALNKKIKRRWLRCYFIASLL